MHLVLTFVAVAATALGSGMAFPQALRLFRTGATDGVSAVWIGVSLAINGWWAAYAMAVSLWVLLPVSIVSFVLYAWIGSSYLRAVGTRGVGAMAVGILGLGMIPLPVLIAGGWDVAGVAVGLAYGIQLAPAVVGSFQTRALGGIAPETWIISLAEAALWLGYGFGVADWALVAGGVSGVVMAGTILGRLAITGFRPFARLTRRPLSIA